MSNPHSLRIKRENWPVALLSMQTTFAADCSRFKKRSGANG